METVSGGGHSLFICWLMMIFTMMVMMTMMTIHMHTINVIFKAVASAAWGSVQAARETDEEQERAWCQVNLNQLFLQF